MKKLFLLIVLLVFYLNNAQVNRFIYELKFVRDTIAKTSFINVLFLDVNNKDVKFYYQELYEEDSVQRVTKNYSSGITLGSSLMLKRSVNSFDNENYVFIDTDYYKYNSNDKLKWEILPETKTQKEYTLQKAKAEFGGRKWTAWFCKDVPINQGPYKFQGLPGLIFQIEDNQKHYFFNLTEIKKLDSPYDTTRILETNFGKKAIPITLKKYNELLSNAYYNPYSEIRTKFSKGEDYTFSAYGKEIKTTKDLDELRKVIQSSKRKNYNPIEIDKAIEYKE
ncbi:GLPGLI family protein [Chryseobacterium sp. KACC 21268]|nr:GLPGLI family protein [Chryseobacterium sp. KACC 21268]